MQVVLSERTVPATKETLSFSALRYNSNYYDEMKEILA